MGHRHNRPPAIAAVPQIGPARQKMRGRSIVDVAIMTRRR